MKGMNVWSRTVGALGQAWAIAAKDLLFSIPQDITPLSIDQFDLPLCIEYQHNHAGNVKVLLRSVLLCFDRRDSSLALRDVVHDAMSLSELSSFVLPDATIKGNDYDASIFSDHIKFSVVNLSNTLKSGKLLLKAFFILLCQKVAEPLTDYLFP